jgi:hypothetical protein
MGSPLRVVAAALMCVGLTACVRTTAGSVAMTTEPDNPTSTSSPIPASPGAMNMKCDEFTKLDQPKRRAVVKQILATESSPFGPLGDEFAESMASTMCQFMPDRTVHEILTGSRPR